MDNENKKSQQMNINIELDNDVAEGIYSNLAVISHSNSEFVIDFLKVLPGLPKAKVKSRVILTPLHAKRLLKALEENVQKYEQSFGKVSDNAVNQFNVPFGGPAGQA